MTHETERKIGWIGMVVSILGVLALLVTLPFL